MKPQATDTSRMETRIGSMVAASIIMLKRGTSTNATLVGPAVDAPAGFFTVGTSFVPDDLSKLHVEKQTQVARFLQVGG